jgi:hypothetical protein
MMSHLGRSLPLTDEISTPDQIIANYDAVTGEQVRELAGRIFDFDRISLSAVGRVRPVEEYRNLLKR